MEIRVDPRSSTPIAMGTARHRGRRCCRRDCGTRRRRSVGRTRIRLPVGYRERPRRAQQRTLAGDRRPRARRSVAHDRGRPVVGAVRRSGRRRVLADRNGTRHDGHCRWTVGGRNPHASDGHRVRSPRTRRGTGYRRRARSEPEQRTDRDDRHRLAVHGATVARRDARDDGVAVRGRCGGARGQSMPKSSRMASFAAHHPFMPCTAGPGGVALEQRYTPGTGVRHGAVDTTGRFTNWARVSSPE